MMIDGTQTGLGGRAGAVVSVGAFQIAAKHDDLLPSPTSTAAPPAQQQHIKWLSFYDYNATEQHKICNLGMHQSLDRLLAGFAKCVAPRRPYCSSATE